MRRYSSALVALLAFAAAWIPAVGSAADTSDRRSADRTTASDIRHVGPDYNGGRPLPISNLAEVRHGRVGANATVSPSSAAKKKKGPKATGVRVGQKKDWLGLDDTDDSIYVKKYRLRGVGKNIEVWTAADKDDVSRKLNFPAGDCRNGARTKISDKKIRYFIRQFDNNMFPKESEAFSVPPRRNGKQAQLDEILDNPNKYPKNYWRGDGRKIVVLIDNVRDENFYDTNNQNEFSYIAGFHYSVFNELFDRNVMSIDAFDWLHRTGANPPNDPAPGDPCASAPARPFLYEGTFAHEYEHLLEYYEDPGETNWIDEGLADWAQTLTGYVDPSAPIDDQDFDSHIQCFLGYLSIQTPANPNPDAGGAENSLTVWGDQDADHESETLCDYGAAYTMMEFLAGRYGNDFMRDLHTDDAPGLESLGGLLAGVDPGKTALDVVHEWAAMVALDGILDAGATLTGGDAANYTTPTLDATINWDTDDAYDTPGAPPNGSDYVRLRDGSGAYLPASAITSIEFDGAETLAPRPIEWTVDANPPEHEGNPALYSGSGPSFDRAIVQQVSVPADNPTLTFQTKYETEELFDYGFVQVSTDGGQTYTSLANENTTEEHDPTAIPLVVENLPGLDGDSGGWVTETFDLTPYAGQDVLLSFRYITDTGVDLPGWWIDDVMVGDTLISDGSSLAGWQSTTEVNPIEVSGFTVQLISYDEARTEAHIAQLPLGAGFTGSLSGTALTDAIGSTAEVVAAIVTYDEPTESFPDYASYTLTVNGVQQPGG
jgi:Immune inhibitor A peptidase M6